MQVDPIANQFPAWNPYHYVYNNPMKFIDPTGMVACPQVCGAGYYQANVSTRTVGFVVRHPIAASRIGNVSPGKSNISTNAVRFSTRSPQDGGSVLSFGANKEGGQVNAFRHTLWQATIASEFGESRAAQIGNVHESNPFANLSKTTFKNSADADGTVDLLNNQIGRDLAKANPGLNMKDLSLKILDTFLNDALWTSQKGEDGSFTISRTKITQEQHDQLRQIFNELDENGRREDERN
jgi:hypothetical protein